MVKLKLSSWLSPSSSTKPMSEKKEQNRRPLPASVAGVSTKSETQQHTNHKVEPSSSLYDMAAPTSETPAPSQMITLARTITRETEKLEGYMREKNLPMPSFNHDGPEDFPKLSGEMARSRQEIILATKELRDLVVGPKEGLRWGVWDYLDVLALQIINHYGIAKLFPPGTTIPLTDLQTLTPLDPVNLARVLRLAMTNHIFTEPHPGLIAHTAASAQLASDPDLQGWIGFNAEDNFPAAAHVLQALKTYPAATSFTQAGFQFAFGTVDKEPMFATFAKDPARSKRMAMAMTSLTGGEGYELSYLVDGGCDFGEVDERGGVLVDLGGSHGVACGELAKRYRKMRFVVQDTERTLASAKRPVSEDEQVARRIELMAHDFFKEQVVRGADVYFFRWIIHNYSTPYATQILRALIPALKPGARIIINDYCLREAGEENPLDDVLIRRMDLVMMSLLNSQERTEAEYKELFKVAHAGFVFKGVTRPKGCRMSIIEAVWQPSAVVEE